MLKKDSKNNFDNNINQLRLSLQANVGVNLTSTTKANVRLNAQVLDYSGSAAGTAKMADKLHRSAAEHDVITY